MKKNIIPINALRMIWRKRYNGNLWGGQEGCNYVVLMTTDQWVSLSWFH